MNISNVTSYGAIANTGNPYAGDIYGLRGATFGASTLGSTASYRPQNSMEQISTSGVHTKRQATANTFIQYSYPLVPFGDKSETRIMENMLVFVARHMDKKHGMYPFVSIGKLNTLIREHHVNYHEWLSNGDASTVFFNGMLNQPDVENKLQFYQHLLDTNDNDGIGRFKKENDDFHKFYELAKEDVYCYQTEFGIRQRWNWSGVVLSKLQGTSLMSMDLTAATSELYVINVVVGEKARVFNYWGSTTYAKEGSKVFLVLKRAQAKNNLKLGPFQVYPFATRLRETVPDNFRKYVCAIGENSKRIHHGHCWKIGTVSARSGKEPHAANIQAALGLNCTEKLSYEACSTLPLMYVQLGI